MHAGLLLEQVNLNDTQEYEVGGVVASKFVALSRIVIGRADGVIALLHLIAKTDEASRRITCPNIL